VARKGLTWRGRATLASASVVSARTPTGSSSSVKGKIHGAPGRPPQQASVATATDVRGTRCIDEYFRGGPSSLLRQRRSRTRAMRWRRSRKSKERPGRAGRGRGGHGARKNHKKLLINFIPAQLYPKSPTPSSTSSPRVSACLQPRVRRFFLVFSPFF